LADRASNPVDEAAARNIRRLLEELTKDQADLASTRSLTEHIELIEGNILVAEAVAAAEALADALRPHEKNEGNRL
jgi:hypothetical protein